MNLDSPIRELKGIGAKTEELLHKAGVYTLGDILLYFPRDYIQYPKKKYIDEIKEGETAAVFVRFLSAPKVRNTKSISVASASFVQNQIMLQVVWFRMPFLKNTVKPGQQSILFGKVSMKNHILTMEQPIIYTIEQYEQLEEVLMPVYPLVAGLKNNVMNKAIRQAIQALPSDIEFFHNDFRKTYQLMDFSKAIQDIHFPKGTQDLILARRRIAFDEFFFFLIRIRQQKENMKKEQNPYHFITDNWMDEAVKALPFKLTKAQLKTLEEIKRDLNGPHIMQRLVQGDVGSGKTIVAFLAMAHASKSGYQSAIMAPTEVLAKQHLETFQGYLKLFAMEEIPLIFLSGSCTAKQKREAYEQMREKKNAIVIGTNALIQEKAVYDNLSLVVTDEQHRFGVKQREVFSDKGLHPHVLVMSATPIPRTLAIILYGDLDISVMNELPAKRLPIKNCVVKTGFRPKAYQFIKEEVQKGHQGYIICPLVEETENSDKENVIDYCRTVQEAVGNEITVAYLHGKMKPNEKEAVMEHFSKNEIQILVSTTVIEVGVNVPNATVMMIEDAQGFGLAQLHQLRGRVGRGEDQSYCIMINSSDSKKAEERLNVLNQSNDGFFIASEDLKLRGPGDFFGIRQSGEMEFQVADIYQDAEVLQQASEACTHYLAKIETRSNEFDEIDLPLQDKSDIDVVFKKEIVDKLYFNKDMKRINL